VSGTEDPRTNVQSILTRALIADTLWPGRFDALIDEELRFGAVMSWVLSELGCGRSLETLHAAVASGTPAAGVPAFVTGCARQLSDAQQAIPDYLTEVLTRLPDPDGDSAVAEPPLETFERIWSRELKDLTGPRVSIFEPACGSANDYRFLERFGFARFLGYHGIDIAARNVENARRRHPGVSFERGNAYATGLAEGAFDFVFVHDLYEHLSVAAMERALAETLRVTRRQAWLHFFNLADVADHEVRPVETYHWNLLSLGRVCQCLRDAGASAVEVLPVPSFLEAKFGSEAYFNREAVTLVVTKEGGA
jgi:SAM-dependent methyltransferase